MSSKTKTTSMKEAGKPALTPKLRFPEFRGDGVWDEMPLGSLSKRLRRKVGSKELTPVSITAGFGFVDQTKKFGRRIAGEQYKNYIHIQRGDFVFNKGNSKTFPQGCIYQLKEFEEAAASTAFICFKLNANCVDHYFQSLFECNTHGRKLLKFITSGARSDGLLNINPTDFFSIELPLPPHKEEQQKIAECLSSVDELIAAQSQKLDALKTHKKGLMQQLFPREGETKPRRRFPEFQNAPEWDEKNLETICKIQRGKFSHRPRNDPRFFGGKYPFIQTGDVVKSNGGSIEASQSLNELGLSVSKLFKPTIVLITIAANIGDTGLLDREACFTDSVVGLIPKNGVCPYFLELAVRGKKEYLNTIAPAAAQKNINNAILSVLPILVPEFKEQQRIASCLTSLDDLIAAVTQKLEALKTHKKGLMQQLFPSPKEVEA